MSSRRTDNEIIESLKWHINNERDCTPCPYADYTKTLSCVEILIKDALDLILNLQADKDALIAGQETLQKCISEKIAEIEALKLITATCNADISQIREIAIDEFVAGLMEELFGANSQFNSSVMSEDAFLDMIGRIKQHIGKIGGDWE